MFWHDSRKGRNQRRFDEWDARGLAEVKMAIPLEAIKELQANIQGSVLLPGDKGYEEATHVANPRFQFHPELIVLCASVPDVGECLAVIQQYGIQFCIRSGGHNTAGYSGSNVMILDVSKLDGVQVDPVAKTAVVEPGCNWGSFNAAVEVYGLHLPGGACPDVCQGGYMQGGGYGFTARIFGMNCDQPSSITVMLASGLMVQASPTVNSDLFWAMRGGTGNNFGVLLSTTYPLYTGDTFLGFSVAWDLSTSAGLADASQSLSWLQDNFVRSAPDQLGFQMVWVFEGPTGVAPTPTWRLMGMYDGAQSDLEEILAPLLAQPGAALEYYMGPMVYSALNEYLMTNPYDVPEFPPNINPDPPCENKVSRYIEKTLTPAQWLTLLNYFVTSPNPYTTVAFEGYHGTIGSKSVMFNAFVHRTPDFDCFMDVFWLKPEDEPVMEGYLDGWKTAIRPFWDGQVYQNYPSDDDPDFARQYWLPKTYTLLQLIKRKYDPDNMFQFPQSIRSLVPADIAADEPEAQLLPSLAEPITLLPQPSRPPSSP
jgi:FAD binding domain/Berberine and berberine like